MREDGNRIRLSGEGEAGYQGGPSGDLYIFIKEKPHSIYKRNAENLYILLELDISAKKMQKYLPLFLFQ